MDVKIIVFIDGDDTLWDTQSLYDRAISDASEAARQAGIDVTGWQKALHEAEEELMPLYGFAKERFPAALVRACALLCRQQMVNPSDKLSQTLQGIGMSVFDETASLFPDAGETLGYISARASIYLVSAGPQDVQDKRLLQSGLGGFFIGYCFPQAKTKDVFISLIEKLEVEAGRSWHIGNSIKSDINPAREAGLNAILVGNRGWAYDRDVLRDAKTGFERASHLRDAIPVLTNYYGWAE